AGLEIAATREALPKPAPWPVKATREGGQLTFSAGPGVDIADLREAVFFPYHDGLIENATPQDVSISDGVIKISTATGYDADSIADAAGLIVLHSESGAPQGFTFNSPISWTGPGLGAAADTASLSVGLAILFAFLGGIILNAMPCVLPVLVMKGLSFVSRATTDAAALRKDGLAYTAGVIAAFGVLVGVLLGLRAGGTAVGWGFQLQSPAFVAIQAYVMLVIGLNLSGVFTLGGNFGVGQQLAARKGPGGAFFTGLLAVVVATPCTAPFMGAAMGFALTQPPIMSVIVFQALALGLALPYLLLAFVPGAAKALPRPGPWMDRLRQILAFPMYAVAAWLIWVLTQQVDALGLAAALSGLILVAFAAWLWGLGPSVAATSRRWTVGASIASVAAVFAFLYALSERPPMDAGPATASDGISEPYSEARLAELRAEGRPVFVNFTAAWCITCKVNERVALSTDEVRAAFSDYDVAYLKADWTNRNDAFGEALRAQGRDGVPLYLLYGPGRGSAEILPQILTPGLMVEAFENL
ncbi:MAG: thioredoxin family protein, partial [Rhodospirillaceae bacterium]